MKRFLFISSFIIVSCFNSIPFSKELPKIDYSIIPNRIEVSDTTTPIKTTYVLNGTDVDLAPYRDYDLFDSNSTILFMATTLAFILFVFFFSGIIGMMYYFKTKNGFAKNSISYEDVIEKLEFQFKDMNLHLENKFELLQSDFQKQLKTIKQNQTFQDQYLDQTVCYLFQTIYSIISQINDKYIAKNILENFYHSFQIAKLYQINNALDKTEKINKFAAFAYIEENGVLEDIPHLEYIAEHDPNEQNENRAKEIIGRIKERNKRPE